MHTNGLPVDRAGRFYRYIRDHAAICSLRSGGEHEASLVCRTRPELTEIKMRGMGFHEFYAQIDSSISWWMSDQGRSKFTVRACIRKFSSRISIRMGPLVSG